MNRIKKGLNVEVTTGKDKGKKGEVIRVLPKKSRVTVKGVNLVKKTVKKSKENPSGGFIEIEASLNVSNVMPFCPKCNKGVRVGVVETPKGGKVLVCKKCGHKFE